MHEKWKRLVVETAIKSDFASGNFQNSVTRATAYVTENTPLEDKNHLFCDQSAPVWSVGVSQDYFVEEQVVNVADDMEFH